MIHGKPVYFKYCLTFDNDPQLEIEVFGVSLFEYYFGWEMQNLVKINGWTSKKCFDVSDDDKRYNFLNLRIGSQPFYFIAPRFFEVYVQNLEESSKIKVVFMHKSVQKFTRILTEPVHYLDAPEKYNFAIAKVYKTKDHDLAFSISNRKGRTFTIIKGALDLAIFCNRGIESWLTTYKLKKEIKKEIKKEK